MGMSEVNIHVMTRKAPKVIVQQFGSFYNVTIKADVLPAVKFFIYSPQQMVNFKNNFLQAFKNPKVTK